MSSLPSNHSFLMLSSTPVSCSTYLIPNISPVRAAIVGRPPQEDSANESNSFQMVYLVFHQYFQRNFYYDLTATIFVNSSAGLSQISSFHMQNMAAAK